MPFRASAPTADTVIAGPAIAPGTGGDILCGTPYSVNATTPARYAVATHDLSTAPHPASSGQGHPGADFRDRGSTWAMSPEQIVLTLDCSPGLPSLGPHATRTVDTPSRNPRRVA